ncbi:hypothetical protein NW762_004010 [Fusarium torreyae]|uniref:Uncharacterized protein n=1 Tax=Fusarium torreyae TaxID=1237075 RepID=A0A9W8S580_9HYPO|nr:hypothetical protein NW762_004010 [Fusarium torreyae]
MLQTAQAPAQPQGRTRSNSLQRMLDLEKKLSFLRSHQGSVPPSPACTDSSSVPPSPGHPPRRFELVPKDKKMPPPVRNYSAVPPPLFSAHTAPARTGSPNLIPRKPVGHDPTRSSSQELLPKESPSEKPGQKTVAFMFPPEVEEQRSVCQSPTWEAYDRRKKEKKEEKRKELERKEEEKRREKEKEREQAMNAALEEAWKNAPKPRGRKLSKPPPPPPSVLATQGRSITEPTQPTQKRRSRSSSLLGFSIGRNNDDPEEPRRSRSSSLTSIFRSSFEIKRASFDETSSTGFLGGVKLEKKKEDFHQKVLEDQAKGNSKVHPAMRKTFLGHGSFTPLKVNPQQAHNKEAEGQKKSYPPISINTSGARGQSIKSPKSPQRRGSVNIYLWSARLRRGSVSEDCAVADDTEDEGDQITVHTPDSEILYNKAQGLNRRGGLHIKKDQNAEKDSAEASKETENPKAGEVQEQTAPAHRSSNQSLKQIAPLNIKTKDSESAPQQDTITVSRPPVVSSTQPRPRRASASSGLSVPPTPPRRSSKRGASLTLLTRLNPSQTPSDEPSTAKSAPVGQKSRKSIESTRSPKEKLFKHNPPSIRYEQTSPGVRPKPITAESEPAVTTKWNLREAAKSAFGRGHSAQGSVSSTASKEGSSPKSNGASPSVGPPVPPKTDVYASKVLNVSNSAPIHPQHIHTSSKHLSPGATHSPAGGRPTTSSSESSYSDAIQSVSPLSTPHTTPPQSEMGHSPNIASVKPSMVANLGHEVSPYWSYTNSPRIAPSDRFEPSDLSGSDAEMDPIQEAANRVMEAFSNANLRSSASPRNKRSVVDSSDERSFASTPTHTLKHKERSTDRLRSPVPIRSPTIGHRPTLSDPEAAIKTLRRQSNLEHHQHHQGEPSAKIFVECCACRRYHDMPSRLYEAMSNPDGVLSSGSTDYAGSVSMTIKCSWCKHEMSTKCCAGFAAMVYIKERFH